ncbi:hypothetical protein NQ314_014839, partial [Rhamnusium bicolor]
LSGQSSHLSDNFNPPLYLDDDVQYEIGLTNFETYNSIPNIDDTNNTFIWGKNYEYTITIPTGAYNIDDITNYTTTAITQEDEDAIIRITLDVNISKIKYELNGIAVDSVRNVGLVSTIKNYLSYNENESVLFENASWFPKKITPTTALNKKILVDSNGNFNVCIPSKLLLGFFEDFRKLIINMKQKLVLIRGSNDNDAITSEEESEEPKIEIQKLFWRVPHVTVSIQEQLKLNKIVNRNIELPIKFRSWELIEYPFLSTTTRHGLLK